MYFKSALNRYLICFAIILTSQQSSFPQPFKIVFGDLHEHTKLSWDAKSGALSPRDAFIHGRNVAKLDFMAITDHANDLNNGKPLEGWQMILDAAQAMTVPDFVALGSQEVGLVFARGGYGHLIIHNSPDLADNSDLRLDLNSIYNFIIQRNALAHFAHPGIEGDASTKFNNFEYVPQVDPFMYGLEVLSGFNSFQYEKYYLIALNKGWHVGAVTGQDNHAGFYGDRFDSRGNINLTGVLVDTLDRSNLLEALQKHRTFAFQTSPFNDRMFLTKFTADGHWMGEIFQNDDNIVEFKISAHAQMKFVSAQLYKNGILFKTHEPDSPDFTWTPVDSSSFGAVYYFVKLVQEDTDMLWSSPIWVNSPGEAMPSEPPVVSIAQLRENFANGIPRRMGWTNITIRGVATVGREFGERGPGFLQDDTGGIAVFGSQFTEQVIPGFALEMEVTGAVSFFNGQTEFIPYSVKRLRSSSFPQPEQASTGQIAQEGESLEGKLVRVTGANISGSFPPTGANANLTINDGTGPCTLRIDKDTNIPGNPTPSGKVNITGVVGQFDSEPPYDSGYQLLPRSMADIEIVTHVEKSPSPGLPERFILGQNYPNPFNPETNIPFKLPRKSQVKLVIIDTRGQIIKTLVNKTMEAGEYQILWDSKDDTGKSVASGVYLYRLTAGSFTMVKKMVVLR